MAKSTLTDGELITITLQYKKESDQARYNRIQQNRVNFDCYHMRQDFSQKQKGQSREFLPKMSMAVEQNSIFIQQGLVDIGDWFKVEAQEGLLEDAMKLKPSEIYKLLDAQLKSLGIIKVVANSMKLGMIGSLMIAKVHGQMKPKPKFKAETKIKKGKYVKQLIRIDDKAWNLQIDLVRQEDYFPDPTGNGLYELEDIYVDYWKLVQMAEAGMYEMAQVELCKGKGNSEGYDREYNKNRETDQNATAHYFRNRVKLTECWGNIVNSEGELIAENVVWTIANDTYVIQKPTENPLWHGESPYVTCPILDVPHGVWGRAMMDAPTMLNRASNEFFNLILDGGMMSVHGIKQIHEHWLEDSTQVDNGIAAGDTLRANASCPPGMSVLSRVDTATIPQDALPVFNLLQQEFYTAAMTNDLRMGAQPFRDVKATAIVESSQTITGMFGGIAKHVEEGYIEKLLTKSWMTQAQHMQELDFESLKALLGSKRAEALKGLTNQDLFAETVSGCKFKVFGISATLAKQKDFTKLQAMMQTIASSPVLMEEFTKKYDFGKLLTEIMISLDIRPYKLESDQAQGMATPQPPPMQQGPDSQSQIPQAGAAENQGDLNPASAIPNNSFPGSRANEKMVPNLGG